MIQVNNPLGRLVNFCEVSNAFAKLAGKDASQHLHFAT